MTFVELSNRTANVQNSLCRDVSSLSLICSLECAKVNLGVVVRYARSKSRSIFENSKNACRFVANLCFALVLNVLRLRDIAQVFKTIVRFVAIYMVNYTLRPIANYVKPSQPMTLIQFPVNRCDKIATLIHTSCNRALRNTCLLKSSRENASFRTVIKDL